MIILAQPIAGPPVRAWIQGDLVYTVGGDVSPYAEIIVRHSISGYQAAARMRERLKKAGYVNVKLTLEDV